MSVNAGSPPYLSEYGNGTTCPRLVATMDNAGFTLGREAPSREEWCLGRSPSMFGAMGIWVTITHSSCRHSKRPKGLPACQPLPTLLATMQGFRLHGQCGTLVAPDACTVCSYSAWFQALDAFSLSPTCVASAHFPLGENLQPLARITGSSRTEVIYCQSTQRCC